MRTTTMSGHCLRLAIGLLYCLPSSLVTEYRRTKTGALSQSKTQVFVLRGPLHRNTARLSAHGPPSRRSALLGFASCLWNVTGGVFPLSVGREPPSAA